MNDNWAALCVSIVKGVSPEVAFLLLNNPGIKNYGYAFTDEDTKDMVEFKKQGLTYKEIADIYGLNKDMIFRRIKRFNKRRLAT
jgi:hypothetical protein